MTKVGEHITLDIIGTTKEYDPTVFEKVINDIAKAAKVTILNISKYKFEPQGFTILALLFFALDKTFFISLTERIFGLPNLRLVIY